MIGTRVMGMYTVTKALGEGGMGAVYLAASNTGHEIAIKVLHPEYSRHPAVMARFRQEASTAARIKHRNVIAVQGSAQLDDGRTFLVMEYLQGKTLTEHMRSWGPQLASDALPILIQLCAGLQAAHRRDVVHRDLKPDNVFLCDEPEPGQVKIMDFGISKQLGDANGQANQLTGSGVLMGTPSYMPPEQADSARDVTRVADIFSLGVIAFELLAGRRPYQSDKPESAMSFIGRYTRVAQGVEPRPSLARALAATSRDDIPAAWYETIDRAIDVAPEARPRTPREFIEPLYRAIAGGEALARKLALDLFDAASPDDATSRAPTGEATWPGSHTAPHVTPHITPGPLTTFHNASGQVSAPSPPRSRRAIFAAVGGALVLGGGIVFAVLASRPDEAKRAPEQTAVDAGMSAVPDPVMRGEDAGPGQATEPQPDAATAADAARDAAATSRQRPRNKPRSPDDID